MSDWNSEQYLKFKKERTQPSIDLANRIDIDNPAKIIDVGCGPANSTKILYDKFQNADILGVDYSQNMIEKAREVMKTYPKLPNVPIAFCVDNKTLVDVFSKYDFFKEFIKDNIIVYNSEKTFFHDPDGSKFLLEAGLKNDFVIPDNLKWYPKDNALAEIYSAFYYSVKHYISDSPETKELLKELSKNKKSIIADFKYIKWKVNFEEDDYRIKYVVSFKDGKFC